MNSAGHAFSGWQTPRVFFTLNIISPFAPARKAYRKFSTSMSSDPSTTCSPPIAT